jgi:hypothetical protein
MHMDCKFTADSILSHLVLSSVAGEMDDMQAELGTCEKMFMVMGVCIVISPYLQKQKP